ncbi:hypothetical protein [Nocardia sp. NPDC047648]|uniref:hypothetical protein n=1 Tax=Nocardia sp. NPDC047648 TaxID=3155625 RepID=UPI003402C8EB
MGTAHYGDVAMSIVNELGETPVGFGINADFGDRAGRRSASGDECRRAGRIALAHMHRPRSRTAEGMAAALPKIRAMGFTFVHP